MITPARAQLDHEVSIIPNNNQARAREHTHAQDLIKARACAQAWAIAAFLISNTRPTWFLLVGYARLHPRSKTFIFGVSPYWQALARAENILF